MKKNLLAFFLSLSCFLLRAQEYPQGYFRNPLAIPIMLAGNFGECRPGHFHSGIDIKTEGRENLPVFAAADGFVARVKIEPGGFGHALYIQHPNGYTTVYAHLNDFFPAVQSLVRKQQYAQQSWTCDLQFGPTDFPIKKGQQIAWSGNTGGSLAPHLHFEIRNTQTEHPLNPQLFGFKVEDYLPPVPSALAIYDGQQSIYMQKAMQVKLQKKSRGYMPSADTLRIPYNTIHLGVAVHDYMNKSTNTLSVFSISWYVNDSLQGTLRLDDIGYHETRYLNACADYKLQRETGVWFNSLFVLPNNRLGKLYQYTGMGAAPILLDSQNIKRVRIVLRDVSGNESSISFAAKQSGNIASGQCSEQWPCAGVNRFEGPNVKFELPASALYADICFDLQSEKVANGISSKWRIAQPEIPVHNFFDLSIRPEQVIPFAMQSKVTLQYFDGRKQSGKMANLKDGWYSASVRAFGTYWLEVDTIAPKIKPLFVSGKALGTTDRLRCLVTDDKTSVKRFEGRINGRWLCFEQQGNEWYYRIDEHCPKGKSKLQLAAIDENGNVSKLNVDIIR